MDPASQLVNYMPANQTATVGGTLPFGFLSNERLLHIALSSSNVVAFESSSYNVEFLGDLQSYFTSSASLFQFIVKITATQETGAALTATSGVIVVNFLIGFVPFMIGGY